MCSISALAGLLTTTALSIPAVSLFLQKYMHLVLGPVFLLLGMFLVGLITVTAGGTMMSEGMQKRVDAMGIWGALLLGILFAVSFCPTSAAWFFGLLALTMGSEAGAITSVLAQGRYLASHGIGPGRGDSPAADLRCRHGAAGDRGRVPAGLQRPVGGQDLQRAVQSRVVGADDHRLGLRPDWALLSLTILLACSRSPCESSG